MQTRTSSGHREDRAGPIRSANSTERTRQMLPLRTMISPFSGIGALSSGSSSITVLGCSSPRYLYIKIRAIYCPCKTVRSHLQICDNFFWTSYAGEGRSHEGRTRLSLLPDSKELGLGVGHLGRDLILQATKVLERVTEKSSTWF